MLPLIDTPDTDALLTPTAAAALLAVAPATLEKWRLKHQGPAYLKLSGRAVRYRRTDVMSFIAEAAQH